MKPLCFVLDSAVRERTPKAMLKGEWHCERARDSRRFQRIYLDSLDWRLLRSDLCLVADRLGGGFHLRLVALRSNRTVLETNASQLPVFVPSPLAEEFNKVLAPILRRRALVPQIQLEVTRHSMAVLDGQGDTVAYLDLELSEPIPEDGAEPCRLPRRLWFAPVESYEKQNRAIVNILSDYGLPVSGEVFPVTQLVVAMNIDTSRFDARPNLTFHAEDRCDVAAKRLLGFFLSVMETNRPAIVADIDADCLHDFRVALRRSRSLLGQLREVMAKRRLEHARAFFSRLSETTNHQRDLDVMLSNFDFYRSLLPARTRSHLDAVYACIVDQRRAALGVTTHFLNSADYRRFVRSWRKYLEAEPPRRAAPKNAAKPVKAMADARIWKAYRRVLTEGGAIDDESPPEALHSLRKRCKTLRYLIEFFASLYTAGKIQQVLKALKRLQDNLGEYQDLHVHGVLLGNARKVLAEQDLLASESDTAITRVTQALARRGVERRDQFRKCFMAFGAEGNQRMFKRLFRS